MLALDDLRVCIDQTSDSRGYWKHPELSEQKWVEMQACHASHRVLFPTVSFYRFVSALSFNPSGVWTPLQDR